MKLQISSQINYTNLDVLRTVLESSPGDQTIVFTHQYGAGHLAWHSDGIAITIAIPQDWLDHRERADKLQETTRNFVYQVARHGGTSR